MFPTIHCVSNIFFLRSLVKVLLFYAVSDTTFMIDLLPVCNRTSQFLL